MSDPSTPALTICFLSALLIGIGCVALKQLARQGRVGAPPVLPAGKVPTWFYRPLDLLGPAAVFLVFFGLFVLSTLAGDLDIKDYNASMLLFNIGFQFAIATAILVVALQRTSADLWLGLRWSGWYWLFLIAPACVGFMWLVFIGLELLGYSAWMQSLGVETVQDTIQLFQESNDPLVLGLMAFTAVVVAPVCEELVFRGYVYPVMKRYSGILPAAICSSLVFASAHGNLAVVLPLFLLSILLIWLYEKTGSLWAPVAVHGCFNAASVVVQLASRYHDITQQVQAGP